MGMIESLGDRMKNNYEDRYRIKLTRRIPVIIRLDGKSFHTLTRSCQKPFDVGFSNTMDYAALMVCKDIQGAKCAYVASDEISILITDFDTLTTEAWFDYSVQKMVSVSAGIASAVFTTHWQPEQKTVVFDSRAFNVPKEEVCNYFIWRQKDWIRNSVTMLAQAYYSHKQLHKKSQKDMHEMLHEKNINWANLDDRWKNGTFIYKLTEAWQNTDAVIFTQNRMWIEQYLIPIEE